MFIILGSPRSGTTLLATTLSLHSEILVIDQTDYIVPWALMSERILNLNARTNLMLNSIIHGRYFSSSIGAYLTQNEIEDAISSANANFIGSLENIYALIGRKADKRLIGDKSVSDISFFPVLNKVGLFAGYVKIIHLVRDVRAVMASLDRLGWIKDRHIFPRSWAHSNLGVNDLLHNAKHYFLLRYEDLVYNPKKELMLLADFLDVKYEKAFENFTKRGLIYQHDQHHANLQRPIYTERVYAWRLETKEEHLSFCELQASEGLRRFGYLFTNSEVNKR